MKKRKLTNGKVVGKIFLWIFVSLFGMFLLACIFNIFMGTYKKLNHFQTFWNSTLLVIKKTKYAYSLMSLALVFGLGLFLFWKELKNWAKDLWARMTSQTSKDWIYNCATHEGSKKELNNLFRHQIADDTEANWLLTFSKNRKWWYVNDLDQNAIVNGPPGSGKTQRIIIPNIEFMAHLGYENKPNMIITDPKKEVIQFVGKTLENNDYKIYTIDFSNPEKSLAWNPLSAAYNCVHSEKTNDLNLDINHAYEIINNTVEALNWNISTGENNMLHKNKWHEIIKPYFEKLLMANGFDPKNINCFYAMDGNTQYPHVELFFYEKEPTRVKGNFKLETLNIFKGQIANAIGNSDFVNKLNDLTKDVWDARKLILNNVNKLLVKQRNQEKLNDDPKQDYVDFLKASKFITDELKNKHNKSYARLSDAAKNQIEVIKNFLYQKDPTYKEAVDDYQKKIDLIRRLNTDGDKYLEKRINDIIKKEQDDFEKQIGNKIIKALQEARKESKEISNKYDAGQFISNFLDFFSFDNNSNKLMKLAEKEFDAKTVRELELLHKNYRAKL